MDAIGFECGDRVRTSLGDGTVVYRRIEHLLSEKGSAHRRKVAAYSVRLDQKASDPFYSGTILGPEKVERIDGDEA